MCGGSLCMAGGANSVPATEALIHIVTPGIYGHSL